MEICVIGPEGPFLREAIGLLESQNYSVSPVRLSADAAPAEVLSGVAKSRAHLVVLCGEIPMPWAMDFVRAAREAHATRSLPVFHVNPKAPLKDAVEILEAGADDCLAKPFHGKVFLARVGALLRRQVLAGLLKDDAVPVLHGGGSPGIELRLLERRCLLQGGFVQLTRLEFELLALLMRQPGKVFERKEILESVWHYPEEVETRTLDKHIETLRKKLGSLSSLIETVHAVGYRFAEALPRPTRSHSR